MRGVAETVQRRSRGEGSLRCAGKRDLLETGERLGERYRGPVLVDRRLEGPFGELVAIDQRPVDHLLLSRRVAWKGGGGERRVGWDGLGGKDRGELGKRCSMGFVGRNRNGGGLYLFGDVRFQ